jgi:hypothetical protein
MNLSKPIIISSCVLLGTLGLALIFFNQEVLAMHQLSDEMTPLFQLMGALYFGFAITNWTAKNSIMGGIYGRAIVLGNFTHFLIGALALIKLYSKDLDHYFLGGMAAIYFLMALSFGYLLFTHPLRSSEK